MSGKPWTEEMKRVASKRMKGKKLSFAHRAAISLGQLGNKRGPVTGEKIRAKNLVRIGELEDTFWILVCKQTDGCWTWLGNRDSDGYGISIGKNPPERRAHRLAFHFAYGPIPEDCLVCHHCDNPPCCRPDHLFLGDHRDNQRDAWAKGRKKKLFGPDNPMFGRRKINGKFV